MKTNLFVEVGRSERREAGSDTPGILHGYQNKALAGKAIRTPRGLG
jgi:hypothetical protein